MFREATKPKQKNKSTRVFCFTASLRRVETALSRGRTGSGWALVHNATAIYRKVVAGYQSAWGISRSSIKHNYHPLLRHRGAQIKSRTKRTRPDQTLTHPNMPLRILQIVPQMPLPNAAPSTLPCPPPQPPNLHIPCRYAFAGSSERSVETPPDNFHHQKPPVHARRGACSCFVCYI